MGEKYYYSPIWPQWVLVTGLLGLITTPSWPTHSIPFATALPHH
jgi:hypothetical protein